MEKLVKIYDRDTYSRLIQGLKIVQIHKIESLDNETEKKVPTTVDLNISTTLSCSFCKINFEDNVQQRLHYKSDWHRYNLKQNLKSLEAISEEKFESLADDVSSISGSDSESDDNSESDNSVNAVYQGKIYFQNTNGKIISMYRALLHEKKYAPASDEVLLQIVKQTSRHMYWTLLMLGGGHFAGAVFDGSNIVVHKTFHLYTVRAKHGGSQSSRDKIGGAPKSAGASLRRYNEQALIQRLGDLLQTWTQYIEKSQLIFYRAAGPFNRTVLFGGKTPVFKKNDNRLRTIPFSTKRPTFTELKRVHDVLTNIEIYDTLESIKSQFFTQNEKTTDNSIDSPRQSRRESSKNKNINRAKSRETKEAIRPLPGEEEEESSSESAEDQIIDLSTENVEISYEGLQQFGDAVSGNIKKKKVINKKKKLKKKDRIKKWQDNLKRDLYKSCSKNDLELLKNVLNSVKVYNETLDDTTDKMSLDQAINLAIDVHGNTALHIAALNNNSDIILWLLENDCSPSNRNDKQQTPYTINQDKTVRNVFRTFAAENPEKYNYAKSQIPVVISTITEEESVEKKRAQRKIKKERDKEKRKENEIKRKEEDDKNRFLKLSDREKRALAAERRILAQTSAILVRCFLCGEDISGKVPFEYSGNRFCSVACLKAHRMQNSVVLS